MTGYRELADQLRTRVDSGEFPPGSTLPKITDLMAEYGLARQTVRNAVGVLVDDGLVVTVRRLGTVVRHRTPVRIPLSRYRGTLAPGGVLGPWESALAAQGLDGFMKLLEVTREPADTSLAALLAISPGEELVCRLRHAVIRPDDVVQIQHAWYPADIAHAAGIEVAAKVEGGVYRALTATGLAPASAAETVISRPPAADEAGALRIGGRVSAITVERVTRDGSGRPLEVLRAVAAADRLALTYDDLPLVPEV